MKILKILFLVATFISCTAEDDYVPNEIEQVFSDNLEKTIKVDIIHVEPSDKAHKSSYNLDEAHFIHNLNGNFFHRYGIGLEKGEVRTLYNDELYDLKDNTGREATVFLQQTKNFYRKDRINIFIIKRCNTIAIAGIGKNQRALITDEFLDTSTSPHEIGHALGLFHHPNEGNIMSSISPHMRREFTNDQIQKLKKTITRIKKN